MLRCGRWVAAVMVIAFVHVAVAATVTKISWDSKPDYSRFVLQFDQLGKYSSIDQIHEKGFFYVDIYEMDMTYKRRQMKIDDAVVSYVDAVTYPDQKVLRLVFFVKTQDATLNITRTENPPRLVIDSLKGKPLTLDQTNFSSSRPPAGQTPITGVMPPPATVISTSDNFKNEMTLSPVGGQTATKNGIVAAASHGPKRYVIIDPGHGGANSGMTSPFLIGGKAVNEKDVVLQFARELKKVIDASPNMVALLTRTDDKLVSLEDRVEYAERETGDLFISLHCNDGEGNASARGIELWYLSEKGTVAGAEKVAERENRDYGIDTSSASSTKVGQIILDIQRGRFENFQAESKAVCENIIAGLKRLPYYSHNFRGIKGNNFAVLRNSKMPAILIEFGFMTNQDDLASLVNPQFQKASAVLLYNALNDYFGYVDPNFPMQKMDVTAVLGTPAAIPQ